MKIRHYAVVLLLILTGCSAVKAPAPPMLHQYLILIRDVDGHPLSGVTVEYELRQDNKLKETGTDISKGDGVVSISIEVEAEPNINFANFYKSDLYPKKRTQVLSR